MKSGIFLYKFAFLVFFKLADTEPLVCTSHCTKRSLSPHRSREVGVLTVRSVSKEIEAQAV